MTRCMMRILIVGVVFFSKVCFSEEFPPFSISHTEVRSIKSLSNGKEYELYIRLPSAYKKVKNKYPLIVLNDANYSFPIVTSMVNRMAGTDIKDSIIVGISYSKGDNGGVSRTRDYTPTNSPNEPNGHSKESRRQSGHSEKYTKFIETELLPFFVDKYRIDTSKKIFVGHSFGGLLGAYILVTQPKLFDYYIIGSPSFWYDKKVIFNLEEKYSKAHKKMPANVIMIIGELEDKGKNKMVTNMIKFKEQLLSREYEELNIVTKVLNNETHLSAFPTLISNGLRWAIPETKK